MISLEKVLSPGNMLEACRRVIANKGAPGVDGMTVYEIEKHLNRHRASIHAHIREGTYILIEKLSRLLRGWRRYFKLDTRKGVFEGLDIHIRRHLRKLIWIAWKKPKTRERELRRRGLSPERAWKSSVNGRGAWWNAGALHMLHAFPNTFFRKHGLYSLLEMR